VGEWFTSFDDAWEAFLRRDEPLESFWDGFADDPDTVIDAWLIVPPADVKRAALRVQGELEEVRGLRIVPHDFLHVALPHGAEFDGPFEVSVAGVNCFHCAAVAEVASPALDRLDAPETFLPHLSLAYVEAPIDPAPVRDVLAPIRATELGSFVVEEIVRVRVPAAKATILDPWTVVERMRLRR
jgi:2'-5' RNA ligase